MNVESFISFQPVPFEVSFCFALIKVFESSEGV